MTGFSDIVNVLSDAPGIAYTCWSEAFGFECRETQVMIKELKDF